MLPPDPKKLASKTAADTTPDMIGLRPAGDMEPMPAGPPAAVSAPPSLGTLLHAMRRCYWWALPLAALAGILAGAASLYFYPGAYNSAVVFRILVRPAQGSTEDEGHFSNIQRAQVAFLKSHETLHEAIVRSEVAQKHGVVYTPQSLAKKLNTHFNDGPEIMYVMLAGENAEAVTDVLNALGEVYPKKFAQMEEARVKSRIAQLRRRLNVEGDKRDPGRQLTLAELLHDKRIEVAKAEKDHHLDDASTIALKYQQALTSKSTAEQNLNNKQQELLSDQAKLRVKEEQGGSVGRPTIGDADAEELLAKNNDYLEAMGHIKELKAQIDEARRRFTGQTMKDKTRKLQASLDEWTNYANRLVSSARQKLANREMLRRQEEDRKAIRDLRERVEQMKRQEAALQNTLTYWTKQVEELRSGGPKAPPEVEARRDEVKQLEKEFNEIGTQVAAMEGSLPLPPRVMRHAEAQVPTERDTSRSQKIALAVGTLTFLGMLVGLCLLEATSKRVYSSNDVSQGLGMRIIGTLPKLPATARNKTAAAQTLGGLDARYGLTEAIDAIRTVLLHSPRNDGARIIVVTSAIGGEGKTSLASHLAASLARAWRKTLLIDGDLRKPALNEQFDVSLEPGLSEALRGEVEFDECAKPTMTSRLWLLPAGKVDGHSLQALAQDGLDDVFDRLKENFDFIVIDTSPVLLVPDGLMLAQQADTVLLAVMRDHSRIPAVYAAQQKLESLGIHILGSVMIGEKTEAYGHAVPYPRAGS